MNWDPIKGNWTQAIGKIQAQWGKLTDGDLKAVSGRCDQLADRLPEQYRPSMEEVEKQLTERERKVNELWFPKK